MQVGLELLEPEYVYDDHPCVVLGGPDMTRNDIARGVEAVFWKPDEVGLRGENMLKNQPGLFVQLLQAAHFILHRVNRLGEYGHLDRVVVKCASFLRLSIHRTVLMGF